MRQLKIFTLLTSLKREEINGLLLFVEYCEKEAGREYIPLLKEILKYYPYFTGGHISLNRLYSSLYPGRKYNNRVIISRLSELNKLVENFLIKISLEKNQNEKDLLLLEELLSRKQFKMFNSISEKCLENIRFRNKLGPAQLLSMERLMNITGKAFVEQRLSGKMVKHIEDNIRLFTTFAITNTLSMTTGLYAYRDRIALPIDSLGAVMPDQKLIQNTINSLKKTEPLYSSYIELWFLAHKFYTLRRDDKAYFDFVELFYANINNFDRVTLQIMFMLMYSYCVLQDKSGRKEFRKDLFSVLKDIIGHDAYQPRENEYIPALLYREAVRTGILQNDYEWVEAFIKKAYTKMDPLITQNMHNYGAGFLEFHRNNFEASLSFLSKSKSDIQIIEIDIRLMLQMIYYELGMFDQAKNISLSNSKFVTTKKSTNKEHFQIIKNFNDIFSKLLRSKIKGKILFNQGELRKEIEKKTPLYFKKWFMEKAKEPESYYN